MNQGLGADQDTEDSAGKETGPSPCGAVMGLFLSSPSSLPFCFSLLLSLSFVKVLVVSDSFETPWTVAHQVPLFTEFSSQAHWSGMPFPSPGDLPNPGIEPGSPILQTDALPSEPPGKSTRSPGGSDGKASINMGDLGPIPGSGRFPEKEMATHSSTLA